MCGISGFSWKDEDLIQMMNHVNRFRGPDAEGIYCDDYVSLGHRRLAIIDLDHRADQPMKDKSGNYVITYNGEIFNFREVRAELIKQGYSFNTDSDTEVIIAAYDRYGIDAFNHFNGMWALCLYDIQKGELLLVRDRFGVKPLYYWHQQGRLIFSSLISGILCHKILRKPCDEMIMSFLAYNLQDHTEKTFFERILKIRQGWFLKYDLETGECQTEQWYNPDEKKGEYVNRVHDLFLSAVKFRTVSDVPIGCCLSGGIDSSAITCVLDQFFPSGFKTYSLVFPGKSIDESKYIEEVAKKTNICTKLTTFTPQEFLADLPDFINTIEEPVFGISPYGQYRVMKLAHESGAKVLLDGQGGDELFAGYSYYYGYFLYELFMKGKLFQFISESLHLTLSVHRNSAFKIFITLFFPIFIIKRVFSWKCIPAVNRNMLDLLLPAGDPRWKCKNLHEILDMTLTKSAIPHLLNWEDKMSMRWSIETRTPFLDYRLVEGVREIPSDLKLKRGITKYIFREAVKSFIPDLIFCRKDKLGFEVPSLAILTHPDVVTYIQDVFHSHSFQKRLYWNPDSALKLLELSLTKKSYTKEIWKMVHIELWLRSFFPDYQG